MKDFFSYLGEWDVICITRNLYLWSINYIYVYMKEVKDKNHQCMINIQKKKSVSEKRILLCLLLKIIILYRKSQRTRKNDERQLVITYIYIMSNDFMNESSSWPRAHSLGTRFTLATHSISVSFKFHLKGPNKRVFFQIFIFIIIFIIITPNRVRFKKK